MDSFSLFRPFCPQFIHAADERDEFRGLGDKKPLRVEILKFLIDLKLLPASDFRISVILMDGHRNFNHLEKSYNFQSVSYLEKLQSKRTTDHPLIFEVV